MKKLLTITAVVAALAVAACSTPREDALKGHEQAQQYEQVLKACKAYRSAMTAFLGVSLDQVSAEWLALLIKTARPICAEDFPVDEDGNPDFTARNLATDLESIKDVVAELEEEALRRGLQIQS